MRIIAPEGRASTRRVRTIRMVLGLCVCGLALPSAALAAPTTQTTQYGPTGTEQLFTVPDGVTSLQIAAVGASGGQDGIGDLGGSGASVTGSLQVTPGEILYVEVGGNGADAYAGGDGGFNGGGAGPEGNGGFGAGGGGASDVQTESSSLAGTLGTRLLVAGGGGGAGATGFVYPGGNTANPSVAVPGGVGGNGDGNGNAAPNVGTADPNANGGGGGFAGTANAGGAGGPGAVYNGPGTDGDPGQPGVPGVGGSGSDNRNPAGGGGGGVYGGGGGGGGTQGATNDEAGGGGGGGGSSLVPSGGTDTTSPSGTPASVSITYASPTADLSPTPAVPDFGTQPQSTTSAG